MDVKRVTEWLGTAEGLVKAVVAIVGVPTAIWAANTRPSTPSSHTSSCRQTLLVNAALDIAFEYEIPQ